MCTVLSSARLPAPVASLMAGRMRKPQPYFEFNFGMATRVAEIDPADRIGLQ